MDNSDAEPVDGETLGNLTAYARKELEDALSRSQEIATRLASELHPAFAHAVDEDAVRGYPGLPGLVPAAGLTRVERVVEASFAQLIADDPAKAVRRYRELAQEDFGSDRYLNADLALSLLPEYKANKEFRTMFHRATYAPVSCLTRHLVMPGILEQREAGRPLALLLAGGPASGKTTASKQALRKILPVSSIIVDSNLATLNRGIEFIGAVNDSGLRPQVIFIYTPWEMVVRFVLNRLKQQGRPISAGTLAANHYDAQLTFLKLAKVYDGKADFLVFANEPDRVIKKSLEFLSQRTYASQGENGSKETLAKRFQEHVVSEWLNGELSIVEALASGWSEVSDRSLRDLERRADCLRGKARETDAPA